MSPRLYIDCDDTLVLWHDATDDERGYDLNAPLIADINCFLDHHKDYDLWVWSGGGAKYALRWAIECFGETGEWKATAKDLKAVHPGDIVVDDMISEFVAVPGALYLAPDQLTRCPLCAVPLTAH